MVARKPPVSDAELELLKVLWKHGPATVRDISARLRRRARPPAYNTVLTLLSRLREKGYVEADRSGTAHVFRAVATREELLKQDLTALADRICDGTSSPLVHALVKGRKLSRDEIAQFRKWLDELERGH